MSEQQEPERAKEMSDAVHTFYQDAIDNIQFSKRQEWRVANYVVLTYAVIFGLKIQLGTPHLGETIALSALTVIAGALGVFYLVSLRNFAKKMRARLNAIYEDYFTHAPKQHGKRLTYIRGRWGILIRT